MNSAPDTRIGDISERWPFDVPNEIPARAGNDDNLVRSVLSDSMKGIDKLRMAMRVHDVRATVAMKFGKQHTFIIAG